MTMTKPISYLANKFSDSFYTYDMVGTKTLIAYNDKERLLIVMTKEGVHISRTQIKFESFEKFVEQAQKIYLDTLNKADGITFEHKTGWS
jgi:hypothetical protein